VARLDLFLPPGGFTSPDGAEMFSVYGSIFPGPTEMSDFAVSLRSVYEITDPGELMMAKDKYAKLGDTKGVVTEFATLSMSDGLEGTAVSLDFTATGLAYLNAFKGGTRRAFRSTRHA